MTIKKFQKICENLQQKIITQDYEDIKCGKFRPLWQKEYLLYSIKLVREAAEVYGIDPL